MSLNMPPLPSPEDSDPLPSVYEDRRQYIERLEHANLGLEQRMQEMRDKPQTSLPSALPMPSSGEFDNTLKRLVDKIAKILQAEKCVFLLHDVNSSTLYATQPALGFSRENLIEMERRISDEGVSNEVFRTNASLITYDTTLDPLASAENLSRFGIRNAVSVPLIVEKRDEDNRVLDRTTVGVLHVFNKKYGSLFTDEDVRLLEQLARQGAAVIASAQMYREVVQEKQELLHTIDSLYAGLLMVSTNGRLLQINPSARAILGIAPQIPLIDTPFTTAITDPRVCAILERALVSTSSEVAEEVTFTFPEANAEDHYRERIYQIQCAPVRDDDGTPSGIVAIFNDITEIRSVERMKTAFISTVSHELRTPLTSIKGFISTLLEDKERYYDEATRREFYGIIDSECDRLHRLIKDLLDISRIEQGRAMQMNWQTVNMISIVNRVLATQRAYAKDHTLSMDFPEDFPLIEADLDKIDQILTNLINNAIKYSPSGGNVCIIGRIVADSSQGQHAQSIAIRIIDQGIGIPREHLSKIFDRFYRVDNRDNREIGGTGIGLALVKALVEGHHGTVTVESEIDKGTTFTVVLPVHRVSNRKHQGQSIDTD